MSRIHAISTRIKFACFSDSLHNILFCKIVRKVCTLRTEKCTQKTRKISDELKLCAEINTHWPENSTIVLRRLEFQNPTLRTGSWGNSFENQNRIGLAPGTRNPWRGTKGPKSSLRLIFKDDQGPSGLFLSMTGSGVPFIPVLDHYLKLGITKILDFKNPG